MQHYKKKKFDDDEEADAQGDKSKSLIGMSRKELPKNQFFTRGDENSGDLGADDSFNLWLKAPKNVLKYLLNVYKITDVEDLLDHYKDQPEYFDHQAVELITKMFATLKTMESNFKVRGFMKKKTEEMKKHYYYLSNVAALCSNPEIEQFKKEEKEDISEDLTIFTFLNDVIRSCEIVNDMGECTLAWYPMLPKVYHLTENAMNNFRAECRIDRSNTKLPK